MASKSSRCSECFHGIDHRCVMQRESGKGQVTWHGKPSPQNPGPISHDIEKWWRKGNFLATRPKTEARKRAKVGAEKRPNKKPEKKGNEGARARERDEALERFYETHTWLGMETGWVKNEAI